MDRWWFECEATTDTGRLYKNSEFVDAYTISQAQYRIRKLLKSRNLHDIHAYFQRVEYGFWCGSF